MATYGYCRVSTNTQTKGYGLDAQRNEIMKFAKANEIDLQKIFVDAGISGNLKDTDDDDAINQREALIEMLAVLEESDVIIVLNTNRMWRSDMTKVLIRRELLRKKVQLISVEQPKYTLTTKDPNEYLINSMMELLDVYDRMSISLKLARGRTVKAKKGDKPAGLCPYGYEYSADKKTVKVNSDEAPAVKAMFSEAQKGKTLSEITSMLEDKGYKTRRGGSWTRGSVQAILTNDFYVGMLHHAGNEIAGNHEPLISKIQFGKVQSQLAKRSKRKKGE